MMHRLLSMRLLVRLVMKRELARQEFGRVCIGVRRIRLLRSGSEDDLLDVIAPSVFVSCMCRILLRFLVGA